MALPRTDADFWIRASAEPARAAPLAPPHSLRNAARIFEIASLFLSRFFAIAPQPVIVSPIRLNLSSRARELSGGDAIVVSIPKSGRTWVRAFLCAYYCKRAGKPFTLEPDKYAMPDTPRIVYSHDLFEQRTKADLWDKVRGKYLVPASELRRAKIILLARDPRDAFVSHYVQLVRRSADTPNELKQKP